MLLHVFTIFVTMFPEGRPYCYIKQQDANLTLLNSMLSDLSTPALIYWAPRRGARKGLQKRRDGKAKHEFNFFAILLRLMLSKLGGLWL